MLICGKPHAVSLCYDGLKLNLHKHWLRSNAQSTINVASSSLKRLPISDRIGFYPKGSPNDAPIVLTRLCTANASSGTPLSHPVHHRHHPQRRRR